MKTMTTIALFAWLVTGTVSSTTEESVRINDLPNNVKARLIGAKRTAGRAAILVAKFQTLEKEPREIEVAFPTHSFTTHEETLQTIVEDCSDWGGAIDYTSWSLIRYEVIFSIPEKGAHFAGGRPGVQPLSHCYLISLKPLDRK